MEQGPNIGPDGPNFIARSVAGIALSVRVKLLVAFLGITCLLVGLTLFGLYSLHHANVRTEAMIRDQERIAFLTDTYATISNLQAYRCCQTNSNKSQLGQYSCHLCRTKFAPLSESGGACQLEGISAG
ncbi:hypothetical protein CLV75_2369 [Ruegeria conchae]|uniref:Uncharacterized protein n=1 Tax=Ruegeria conchae TaxID=981384 RepID=A0A497ZQJ4_9RHOB|nr:hypothetical protein CLV75_2369 [Ruegeria conchae]